MRFFFFPVCGLIKSSSFGWPPSCMFVDLHNFNTQARNLLSQCRQLVSGCSRICRLVDQWRSRWNLWQEERTNSVSHIFGLKFAPKWLNDVKVIHRQLNKASQTKTNCCCVKCWQFCAFNTHKLQKSWNAKYVSQAFDFSFLSRTNKI